MIKRRVEDGVAIIEMNDGPDNRISTTFCHNLDLALAEVEASDAKALVLTGSGRFFSNGIHIPSKPVQSELTQLSSALFKVIERILLFPLPTVAAINGHAFGAGLMLALACQYRVMTSSTNALVCIPVVHLGLVLPPPLMSLARSKLEKNVVRDMVLSGVRMRAPDALQNRVVDQVCPLADLIANSKSLALSKSKIKSKEAYRLLKQGLYQETVDLLRAELTDTNALRFATPSSKL